MSYDLNFEAEAFEGYGEFESSDYESAPGMDHERGGRLRAGFARTKPTTWHALIPAGTQIEDRTAFTSKTHRKGARNINNLDAVVLHQTSFSRGDDSNKYDEVPVHFIITPDGKIVQLHPLTAYLWSSDNLNARSVAVEFVGNFRDVRGLFYKPQQFGCHTLTREQVNAGRDLIKHLMKQMKLRHVLTHRQASKDRTNDPGPEVWYNVGQWAINSLGLEDGGPGFFVGTGQPIPDEWRKWDQLASSRPIPASTQKLCRLYKGK